MKRYSARITFKRIKQVPKKVIVLWIILGLICLYCVIQLFFPAHRSLDDLQDCQIDIDEVYLLDSHDTKGSRMKLEIVSGDTTYYLWYPQTKYIDFASDVEHDLLTGKVTLVEAKISNTHSFRDRMLNQKRVVDLRSSSAVYYDLDTELTSLQQQYRSLWLLFLFMVLLWLSCTAYVSLGYRLLTFQKK